MSDTVEPTIVIRWDTVVTLVAGLLFGMVVGMSVTLAVIDRTPYVPPCTHEIAEAGGVCVGPIE